MTTTSRWVSPAGTAPGSSPNARTAYGATTSSRNRPAARLSTRTARACGPPRAASRSPATGMLTKAAKAAYRWMPPETDSDIPGRSVGNAAISTMHSPHPPTSTAARRSTPRRASSTANSVEPAANDPSDAGSSQPPGWKAYSLIMPCTGSRPAVRCRAIIAAAPPVRAANPAAASRFVMT
ncbi:hypothetical protein Sru01_34670 [Sphaerisporangium rufum]|uniref:Uncharacterized protein n=1 Tax=Sphaerisporangium rufum TaxID=1381558 RepID=A0A919R774_9ACTN|nr:hypothetical protein [Sphaerisporangium rufum]GII78485.1 hypothetical protein Sru01_34670 [Sphaerisporangium rufum]